MARVALLDVNVLVALFFPSHVHHETAHDWFEDHRRDGWATCPITENGFVRVASQQPSAEGTWRPDVVLDRLRRFCGSGRHELWSDLISLRDEKLFDPGYIPGAGQLTDVYLLGLAMKMKGRLVTFDRSIPLRAVRGATKDSLHVLASAE